MASHNLTMRTILVVLFAVCLFALTDLKAADIDKLSFMAGCWEGPLGDQLNQEMWMRPVAGTMLGTARNVKGDRTTFVEFVIIRVDDGKLGMTVQTKLAGEKTTFPLASLKPGEVVFENPTHDFPQRIIYRSTGKNGLFAKVEGVMKGKPAAEEFPMKRVSCK